MSAFELPAIDVGREPAMRRVGRLGPAGDEVPAIEVGSSTAHRGRRATLRQSA